MQPTYAAVDLGAGSGRVITGSFATRGLHLREVHRFANEARTLQGHERWDLQTLFHEVETGLGQAKSDDGPLVSVGVDTWGVDYGLLDGEGRLLGDPVCYRDPRTEGCVDALLQQVDRDRLFERTGVQIQPFNTLYQLWAQVRAGEWPDAAARLLMMPDLFHWRLCGASTGERTMASTTQLLSVAGRDWDPELLRLVGVPAAVVPALVDAGTSLGPLRPELARRLDLAGCTVVAPATHDTASAVVGTPLEPGQAFLSSGTWSLLGLETPAPIVSAAAARWNLTNEAGAYGSNRLLKNIMGLWVLESCRRAWAAAGDRTPLAGLLAAAATAEPFQAWIDPDDPRFFHPEDMTVAIDQFLRETRQPAPRDPAAVTRIVIESLALRYAEVLAGLEEVTATRIDALRIVGGGSQNELLNQATANASGLHVLAGPVEATAIGNLVVQAITDGRFADLGEARRWLAQHTHARCFEPQDAPRWREARARFRELG